MSLVMLTLHQNLSGNPSINTTGTITATSFSGDGGSITGVNSPVFMENKEHLKILLTQHIQL